MTTTTDARPRIPPPALNAFNCVYLSATLLKQFGPDVRHQMIFAELLKRLDLALGIDPIKAAPCDRLADLGLVGTAAGYFARTLATFFPWVSTEQALSMILGSPTLDDLASALNHKV